MRKNFLDIDFKDPAVLLQDYIALLNRVMMHHCTKSYCLIPQRKRSDESGPLRYRCRFDFPLPLAGFLGIVGARPDGKENEILSVLR